MLTIKCIDYMRDVREFAEDNGILENLEAKLQYLDKYGEGNGKYTECELFKDFAPYSFTFMMYKTHPSGLKDPWFNGGLIYFGPDQPHDGTGPAFTVSVNPKSGQGWSVHT